jgi:hypothetical protein
VGLETLSALGYSCTIIAQRNRGDVERVYAAVHVPLDTFEANAEEENLRAAQFSC